MSDTGFDVVEVLKRLPHRYPLLLVDRVKELVPDERIHAVKAVSFNEDFFQGHFPGAPIMPGVTIIEAMAQTAAVMVGVSANMVDKSLLVYFMGIDACKFRRKVVPGDVLELELTTLRGKPGGKAWRFSGRASVSGELAAEAEFTAMMDLGSVGGAD
jgi:3-hydroxyacyl-[acyl-carrier-protein] dehydratase